eukprot:TRINITY_DN15880_c0_g1_i2.p1 TRINITY_DN15880_c0_g1~~TRINITY_DN15880_c0_g1_i2.p1  ORF type:complete len:170 (-),score=17.65 TRINITY_DN15880_c0_g1_i2:16-525(-)
MANPRLLVLHTIARGIRFDSAYPHNHDPMETALRLLLGRRSVLAGSSAYLGSVGGAYPISAHSRELRSSGHFIKSVLVGDISNVVQHAVEHLCGVATTINAMSPRTSIAMSAAATGGGVSRTASRAASTTGPLNHQSGAPVSYTHLRAHETPEHLVCRLLLEKKKKNIP